MIMELQYIGADKFIEIVAGPEYEARAVELVRGVIVEMSMPNPEHAEILSRLHARLAVFVYENDLGRVAVGDTPYVVERNREGKDTVRGLDLSFLSKSTAPLPLPRQPMSIMPDLAVEVISPGNKAADIRLKISQLLEAGTQEIWVVYPEMRLVETHTKDGHTTLREDDMLTGGEVLPDFKIAVSEIFPA